ncbi:MAG: hypothetical protein HDR46_05000 [Bacteroides sp.]|nr:hypothetical protein [Bacteroides sp.]
MKELTPTPLLPVKQGEFTILDTSLIPRILMYFNGKKNKDTEKPSTTAIAILIYIIGELQKINWKTPPTERIGVTISQQQIAEKITPSEGKAVYQQKVHYNLGWLERHNWIKIAQGVNQTATPEISVNVNRVLSLFGETAKPQRKRASKAKTATRPVSEDDGKEPVGNYSYQYNEWLAIMNRITNSMVL